MDKVCDYIYSHGERLLQELPLAIDTVIADIDRSLTGGESKEEQFMKEQEEQQNGATREQELHDACEQLGQWLPLSFVLEDRYLVYIDTNVVRAWTACGRSPEKTYLAVQGHEQGAYREKPEEGMERQCQTFSQEQKEPQQDNEEGKQYFTTGLYTPRSTPKKHAANSSLSPTLNDYPQLMQESHPESHNDNPHLKMPFSSGPTTDTNAWSPISPPGSSRESLFSASSGLKFSSSESTSVYHPGTAQKTSEVDVMTEILSFIESDNPPAMAAMRAKIGALVAGPTAVQKIYKERVSQSLPVAPFLEVCNHGPRKLCLTESRENCHDKIHFEPVILSTTDTSLGDCSYLDTCFKGKACKYVHYRVNFPNKQGRSSSRGLELPSTSTWTTLLDPQTIPYNGLAYIRSEPQDTIPAQYFRADISKLNLSLLGKFSVIIADPPWDIHMNSHASNPTSTITDKEMLDFNIDCLQDEGIFLLWVTGRSLDSGRQCLHKWGYNHIEEIIWIKTNQLGRTICTGRTGHWLNHSKEHVLMGVKGNPKWIVGQIDVDVIVSTARDKGRKPNELYEMAERMAGPSCRKLELFGRDHNIRPGWLTIGDEITETKLMEHDLKKNFLKQHGRQ